MDSSDSDDAFEQPVDTEAAAQAHINALAGACLALGIKFAGTGNVAARDLLHNYVLYFLSAKQIAPDPVSGGCASHRCLPAPPPGRKCLHMPPIRAFQTAWKVCPESTSAWHADGC